jgi:hypothetical protein
VSRHPLNRKAATGAPAARNRVRIIGGEWRRRWLDFPAVAGLRPTPDRVRETLFNWLGQELDGMVCLDLFRRQRRWSRRTRATRCGGDGRARPAGHAGVAR